MLVLRRRAARGVRYTADAEEATEEEAAQAPTVLRKPT